MYKYLMLELTTYITIANRILAVLTTFYTIGVTRTCLKRANFMGSRITSIMLKGCIIAYIYLVEFS